MTADNFIPKKLMAKYFFILLFSLSCVVSPRCGGAQSLVGDTNNVKKYNFSTDWFVPNIPIWENILSQFKGNSNIHYLEIGVFEGRSIIWMLENILTHPTAKLTCIDIFPGDLKDRFLANLEISGFADKATVITGKSQIELRKLPFNSFDIIYIDGSHTADDVLTDAVLSWPLLKSGGAIIFDDYLWREEFLPKEFRPQLAIDAFIAVFKNYIEIVHQGHLVALKKREIPFDFKNYYYIGQYAYSWHQKKLRSLKTWQVTIELSDREKELIDRLIKSGQFEGNQFSPDKEILKDEEFLNLKEKLRLKLNFEENGR